MVFLCVFIFTLITKSDNSIIISKCVIMKTDSQKEYIDLEVSHILQTKETSSRVYFRHHTRNGLNNRSS